MPHACKPSWLFSCLAALVGGAVTVAAQEQLFVSERLTPDEYTKQIEGPAVDGAGNLYVANLKIKDDPKKGGAIGIVKAGEKKSKLFAPLPLIKGVKSKASGIRFDAAGRMFATDFNNHKIFFFEPGQTTPNVYIETAFNQPNDLAIARDGTLYASDPKFSAGTGRIWRIVRGPDGKGRGIVMDGPSMGTTNGLDLSPDDKKLYVAESNTKKVRAYRIEGDKLIDEGTLITLPGGDPDGVRTDMQGRIYIAHNGGQKITRIQPDGTKAFEIKTKGKNPSNLTFGGPDGKTVFVTIAVPETNSGYIESFRVDVPGREPCLQFKGAFCPPP